MGARKRRRSPMRSAKRDKQVEAKSSEVTSVLTGPLKLKIVRKTGDSFIDDEVHDSGVETDCLGMDVTPATSPQRSNEINISPTMHCSAPEMANIDAVSLDSDDSGDFRRPNFVGSTALSCNESGDFRRPDFFGNTALKRNESGYFRRPIFDGSTALRSNDSGYFRRPHFYESTALICNDRGDIRRHNFDRSTVLRCDDSGDFRRPDLIGFTASKNNDNGNFRRPDMYGSTAFQSKVSLDFKRSHFDDNIVLRGIGDFRIPSCNENTVLQCDNSEDYRRPSFDENTVLKCTEIGDFRRADVYENSIASECDGNEDFRRQTFDAVTALESNESREIKGTDIRIDDDITVLYEPNEKETACKNIEDTGASKEEVSKTCTSAGNTGEEVALTKHPSTEGDTQVSSETNLLSGNKPENDDDGIVFIAKMPLSAETRSSLKSSAMRRSTVRYPPEKPLQVKLIKVTKYDVESAVFRHVGVRIPPKNNYELAIANCNQRVVDVVMQFNDESPQAGRGRRTNKPSSCEVITI